MNAHAAHLRGMKTESRLISALEVSRCDTPHWFHGIEHASPEEDSQGVDAIAHLDAGDVPVQIKSSVHGIKQHQEHYPEADHLILVINPYLSFYEIRDKAFGYLYRWRGRLIGRQRRQNY